MIKQYNEFMCAHCGEDINLMVGQSYHIKGHGRMSLVSIDNNIYKFRKGDDYVFVPDYRLEEYVSEKLKHLKKFDS